MQNHPKAAHQPDGARLNFYNNIHKALRFGHCRLLAALGSHNFTDTEATTRLLAGLRGFVALGKSHLEGENREIHTALEARRPGASAHAAEGHEHHEETFAELEQLAVAVEQAPANRRPAAGHALYKRYALFAADDFVHMNEEETELLSALQQAFTDAELKEIEHRIVAAIPPEKMAKVLGFMLPAIDHSERLELVGGMQKAMPPQMFEAIFNGPVRQALEATDYSALAASLGRRKAA